MGHRYQDPKKYNKTLEETLSWDIGDAKGTAHELGHALGLNHSNQYHAANACKFSLMSQSGSDPRNYLQPTEILKTHQNLRETNLIQFVTPESFLGNTFTINTNTTWDKTKRFYSNLEIKNNVILNISEKIIISPQAKIIFDKNAKINFIGNGKIVDANGKDFTNYIGGKPIKPVS